MPYCTFTKLVRVEEVPLLKQLCAFTAPTTARNIIRTTCPSTPYNTLFNKLHALEKAGLVVRTESSVVEGGRPFPQTLWEIDPDVRALLSTVD
jgi:DNA-binding HxlR family transcriptional regulator